MPNPWNRGRAKAKLGRPRMKNKEKLAAITFFLSVEEKYELKKLCVELKMSMQTFLRRTVTSGLPKKES